MRQRSPLRFNVTPSSGIPIYRQLIDQIMAELASGRLQRGDLLPSVRDAAERLQINPMTASKAYSKLEAQGVVELVRGRGMRVRSPVALGSVKERQAQLRPLLQQALARAFQLGLTQTQVQAVLDPLWEGLNREPVDDSGQRRT
jgi:GntR family transcriptional regulator